MNNTSAPSVVYNLNDEINRAGAYVWPTTVALILLSNTLNIAVLSRRSLRSSSCTHYFLALAIGSLIYMCFVPVNMFVTRFGLSINYSPVGCRIYQFGVFSPAFFTTLMLVCSSVDRFCVSSPLVYLRGFSQVRVAQRVIVIVSISLTIYMSPFVLIPYWDYRTNRCTQDSTTLTTIYLSSRVVLYYIVAPITMAIFGALTIYNIHSHTRRVVPIGAQGHRRTERQLTRMLIIQLGIHLIFSLPTAVTYTAATFVPSVVTPLFTGLRTLSIIWQQGTFFLSFVLYTLSATVFRREFSKLFRRNNSDTRITLHATFTQRTMPAQPFNDTRL